MQYVCKLLTNSTSVRVTFSRHFEDQWAYTPSQYLLALTSIFFLIKRDLISFPWSQIGKLRCCKTQKIRKTSPLVPNILMSDINLTTYGQIDHGSVWEQGYYKQDFESWMRAVTEGGRVRVQGCLPETFRRRETEQQLLGQTPSKQKHAVLLCSCAVETTPFRCVMTVMSTSVGE